MFKIRVGSRLGLNVKMYSEVNIIYVTMYMY